MPFRAALMSVGSALPEQVMTTADICRRITKATGFEITNGLLDRLTGVQTRHYRAEDEQSSDLAYKASVQAIDRADVDKDEIDLIVFAAISQDITEPATANILQEKLGVSKVQVVDVKNACNSFLNGLDLVDSHMRTGKSRCALVASGETLSIGIDWGIKSNDDLRARIASLTLGDAGAAVVLKALPEEEERGILTTRFRSRGEKWRLATVLSGGSMHRMEEEYSYFLSESVSLREEAYELVPEVVGKALDAIGWKPTDVDVVCGHQVTKELVHGISEECGLPVERNAITVTDCGNTGAASIPVTLARAYDEGRLERGSKVILIGGAAGFSAGAIPLIW